jgi:hypothetical protein
MFSLSTKYYMLLEGKKPLERPRHMREDNIKMDFRDIGWVDMNWIYLAQDGGQWEALVNTTINLRLP